MEFAVSFPDVPGCGTKAATLEEARTDAARALAAHLERLVETSQPIPLPSSLKEIVSDPHWKDVNVEMILPAVRPVARSARKGS
jgi:predicted RNase H-like HicB family nuclease